MNRPAAKNHSLSTKRLILRQWRDTDKFAFAKMNADPKVMEFFPAPLSREESDALVERIRQQFATHGFGPWALELKETGEFIGFTGLYVPSFTSHFTPCVEIGWRIDSRFWRKGYATEAALETLRFAFEELKLEEVVSFTAMQNLASIGVMEKIGMHRNAADDFSHPSLPQDHPLSRHVLYRLSKKSPTQPH